MKNLKRVLDDSEIPELPVVPDEFDDEWATLEEIGENEQTPADFVEAPRNMDDVEFVRRIIEEDR